MRLACSRKTPIKSHEAYCVCQIIGLLLWLQLHSEHSLYDLATAIGRYPSLICLSGKAATVHPRSVIGRLQLLQSSLLYDYKSKSSNAS